MASGKFGRTCLRSGRRVCCSAFTGNTSSHCTGSSRKRARRRMRLWRWRGSARRSWSNEQETHGFKCRGLPQGGRNFRGGASASGQGGRRVAARRGHEEEKNLEEQNGHTAEDKPHAGGPAP